MKPIIGIMPLWDDEKESLWMLPEYMDGIREAGALPIMLPLTSDDEELEELGKICNGFLFTGGHDVGTEIYGEEELQNLVCSCKTRDAMEGKILEIAMREDIPVLGICRGIQFINATLGGTLYQDLPTQYHSAVDHHMNPPYDRIVHNVNICVDSPLYGLLHTDKLGVNSYHHQAVKELSPALRTMAVSEDGLIEAVYMPERKFIWAVQWHPEFSHKIDEHSRKIFSAFVKSCKI